MTELKPGGEAPMIAISLPPVEAWQLLHDNLDVLTADLLERINQ